MKILFITCSRIGDAVLTTGVLQHILKNHPTAQVTVAADPLVADLFSDYPLLENLFQFKKQKHSLHWLDLWKQVVKTSWDWVIDLRGSGIAYMLWAKKRTTWKSIPNDTRHKVAQISGCVGIPLEAPHLWVSEETEKSVLKWLPDRPFLALSPAANWVGKQWPLENFIHLLHLFYQTFPESSVLVMAAPHEKPMIQGLLDAFPKEKLFTTIDHNPTLIQTAACIQKAQLFLGNDSGLMHMAAAVKTPTIGLFGPSREENYGPFQMPGENRNYVVRIPLTYDELRQTEGFSHQSQSCFMTGLQVDTVWAAVRNCWEKACL